MYSVVMMMALSGSADLPAWGHRHGCDGCYGGGCSGWSCGGCSGWSCGGCSGSCHGGRHHRHRRHGCSGGCYGGCYGGCSGWSSGCCGTVSHGCYGGCYGGGSYGGAVIYSGPVMEHQHGEVIKEGGREEKRSEPEKIKKPSKSKDDEAMRPAPATIVVSLPASAKLTVDGEPTRSTSATRVFASPTLEPGQDYYYTLKAAFAQDRRTVTTSKRVAVRAGATTRVTFEAPLAGVAQR